MDGISVLCIYLCRKIGNLEMLKNRKKIYEKMSLPFWNLKKMKMKTKDIFTPFQPV